MSEDQGSVAHELCRATSFWPSADSDVEDFVVNLIKKVAKLSEDEFNGMPEAAQQWFNDAAEAKNNHLPVPNLDGITDVAAMNGEAKPAPRVAAPEGDEDPKTASKKKRAAKKKGDTPVEKKPRQLSGTGKVSTIAKIMAHNPDASIDDIKVGLKAAGHVATESVIPTFRSAFRNCFSVLAREGMLSNEMKKKITY